MILVRREALLIRVEVKDHPPLTLSQQGGEAGGSLTREVPGRVGAALTKPGRASTARWCGSGERSGEEYARNQRHYVSWGYSSDRTKLRARGRSSAGRACTTQGLAESSSPGSRPMPTAWTSWTGCGGPVASSAPSAGMAADGPSPMAGTSARPAASGRR